MHTRWIFSLSLSLIYCVSACAEEVNWKPFAKSPLAPNPSSDLGVSLGRPSVYTTNSSPPNETAYPQQWGTAWNPNDGRPVVAASSRANPVDTRPWASGVAPVGIGQPIASSATIVLVQGSEPPPPAADGFGLPAVGQPAPIPPPPPPPPPPPGGFVPGPDGSGVPGDGATAPGFFDRWKDKIKFDYGTWSGCGGRKALQSDHAFDEMISPVSNPFYFEDPRALTEVRVIGMYQTTPRGNPVWSGGSVEFFGMQARVAFTERISLVINKFGMVWQNPKNETTYFRSESGLSELHLGPKFTFLRREDSKTLGAFGVNFEIPSGNSRVEQDTGSLSIVPYLSMAQRFGLTSFGSFNAIGTLGYAFSVDDKRSENFFLSAHLDFDILGNHHFYPLIELNYVHYTRAGTNPSVSGFEGGDLFNFGSRGVAGKNTLSMAIGARYQFNPHTSVGGAIEFPLIEKNDLKDFRLTLDFILRY